MTKTTGEGCVSPGFSSGPRSPPRSPIILYTEPPMNENLVLHESKTDLLGSLSGD